jgi:D-alanine-D-alanine ligase
MTAQNSKSKINVAIFYGGPSPEHDVSVVTALQALSAFDAQKYNAFPVYISQDGKWFMGDALRERKNYLFDREARKSLTPVTLDISRADGTQKKGRLLSTKSALFGPKLAAEFDVAFLAFHGLYGEDGNMQGVMDFAGIPYTGLRTFASALLMDKVATKRYMQSLDIPVLPYAEIKRPDEGTMANRAVIEQAMKDAGLNFPCIIKPTHLGSSIGVAKVTSIEETMSCMPPIFDMDESAILEPFVPNLVEYNAAVSKLSGDIEISAIERPKTHDELLDFKQKYLSGGNDKGGNKTGVKNPGAISEGMLSLTRDINPDMPSDLKGKIKDWAIKMFTAIGGTGAPRIDFIGNRETGEIWLNEVNPIPGSFGYFLWEAAENPLLFTEFLDKLATEAIAETRKRTLPRDPVPKDARLLRRPLSE